MSSSEVTANAQTQLNVQDCRCSKAPKAAAYNIWEAVVLSFCLHQCLVALKMTVYL